MKQEHLGREAQESPGFSRGEEVNALHATKRIAEPDEEPGVHITATHNEALAEDNN